MSSFFSSALTTAARLTGATVAHDPSTGEAGLYGVSLQITSGTLTLVRGTPADGTRTLLRTLAGHVPLMVGTAEVAGQVVARAGSRPVVDPATARRRVGLVLTEPPLFPYLTVAENVALPTRFANRRSRSTGSQVASLCRIAGLGRELHLLPRDLSPAGRQQVALAQVLAYDPDLVLLEGGASEQPDDLRLAALVADLVHLDGRTIVMTLGNDLLARAADQTLRLSAGHVTGGGG